MEPVSCKDVGVGQFVLGSMKVRPRLNGGISESDQPLGIYMQLYNLEAWTIRRTRTTCRWTLRMSQGTANGVPSRSVTGEQLKQNGEQVTYEEAVARAEDFAAGQVQAGHIHATDLATKQTVSRSAEFTVTPASTS